MSGKLTLREVVGIEVFISLLLAPRVLYDPLSQTQIVTICIEANSTSSVPLQTSKRAAHPQSRRQTGIVKELMKVQTMDTDKYSSQLKSKGLKVTSPRLTVLEIFSQSPSRHLCAEDVYKKVLAHEGDIGLATVYRVLTQFADAGILVATNFETGKTTFELNEGGHHDHLVCLSCGSVVEFHDEEVEARQEKIAKKLGFKLINHSMSLYGLCSKPECAASTQ